MSGQRMRGQRMIGRRTGAAVLASAAMFGLAGCGDDDAGAAGESIAAIDVTPDQVATVTFTADGRSASFIERDGVFVPGPDASGELATVLGVSSDVVFPVNAYRILTGVDASTPRYGLTAATAPQSSVPQECGTGCAMEVTSDEGTTWRLSVGGASFNEAGFYAAVEGDPRVFLLIAQTVADIITYARGDVFVFPPTRQVAEVDQKLFEAGEQASGRGAPIAHPYLRQVRAAELDAEAAERGGDGNALRRAATSVEDQAGAEENEQPTDDVGPGAGSEPAPGGLLSGAEE